MRRGHYRNGHHRTTDADLVSSLVSAAFRQHSFQPPAPVEDYQRKHGLPNAMPELAPTPDEPEPVIEEVELSKRCKGCNTVLAASRNYDYCRVCEPHRRVTRTGRKVFVRANRHFKKSHEEEA